MTRINWAKQMLELAKEQEYPDWLLDRNLYKRDDCMSEHVKGIEGYVSVITDSGRVVIQDGHFYMTRGAAVSRLNNLKQDGEDDWHLARLRTAVIAE